MSYHNTPRRRQSKGSERGQSKGSKRGQSKGSKRGQSKGSNRGQSKGSKRKGPKRPNRGPNFEAVRRAFLQAEGVPFAGILTAEQIHRAF